ncbi:hypothetical protein CGCA056_v001939 [Colletotrichum aenigma]|uniref:uncharacterized protein n=1 Tax=Colletotrichum aenigma TaxID=1215731 RepID=UPI0018731D1C|nr:uncharacterized protein CGCA056_v001939 [Colletotrichum aenigma]KAF5528396.1 hypothetical protein CGCA056_v001939 [Colletotrichum aenigma]
MPPSRSRRSSSVSSSDSYRSRSRSRSRSPPRSRSSSAGPHPRNARRSYNNNNNRRPRLPKKKPSFKTTAVLIAAIAVATICIHRVWHKRKHPEVRGPHWDTLNAPGRHSRRRNVVRDRHNGYVPECDCPPRRLPPRRGPRYYEDESDGYLSDYNPPPRTYRLAEEPRGQRLTEEAIMGPPRDEIVRYAKTSGRSEAESSKRFFDEDNRSRRVEDAVEDWSRRGAARFPSPDGRRPETVYDDRRSRRRSDYY